MSKKKGMSSVIGLSLTGLPFPIFYDPHYAIQLNRPPVTLVTGEPGSGKTFFSLILAAHSSLFGKLTIIIDPKGDFIALKLLEKAGYLKDIKIWSVFSDTKEQIVDRHNVGMLDPLRLRDKPEDNVPLALEVIEMLVENVSNVQKNALIPILKDVSEDENPSMSKVLSLLKRHPNEEVHALAHSLEVSFDTSAAKLLIAPYRNNIEINKLSLKEGTIIASLLGLSFPPPTKNRNRYSTDERVAVAVMKMLTQLVIDTMTQVPQSTLKTLVIDEAWSVFATESGQAMIDQVSLLGRSRNIATIAATQSPLHLSRADNEASLDTTISTRFAFRTKSIPDVEELSNAMKLPGEAKDFYKVMEDLQSGQCLMRDVNNNLSFVKVMPTDPNWIDILSTTPEPEGTKDN